MIDGWPHLFERGPHSSSPGAACDPGRSGTAPHTYRQHLAKFLDDGALRRYTESDLCWDGLTRIEEFGEQSVYRVKVAAGQALVAGEVLLPGG